MINKTKSTNTVLNKLLIKIVAGKHMYLSSAICFLFAFILYSNTITHSYVLDDGPILANNRIVAKGIQGVPTILKTSYWYGAKIALNTYRPLSLIMFALEWQLSPNDPTLNHFINVFFYALSCFLLFIVLRKYLSKAHYLIPLLITLLYAAHPIHTEVVANIKSRDEIMSFFFLMLTLLLLHTWFTKKKWWSLIVSLLVFFFTFLSKEGVIPMLLLFPVIGWYFTEAKPKTILIGSLLLLIPAIAYIVIRDQVLSNSSTPVTINILENFLVGAPDVFSHFATAIMLLGKYLLLSIIPYQLVCDYSYNQIPIVGLLDIRFIISFLIYIAIGIYIILNFRKKSPLVFGLLFFMITISMYSNVIFQITASFGERLLFLPSLGLCIAFVFFIDKWINIGSDDKLQLPITILKSKPLYASIFIFIILIFSVKTHVRASEWENETTLFSSDIKHSPKSAQLCLWFGHVLFNKAKVEGNKSNKDALLFQAVSNFDNGLKIYPSHAECYEYLCSSWLELGDTIRALDNANKALQQNPGKAEMWYNTDIIYYDKGDLPKALEYYDKTIRIDPSYADAYFNMGGIYGKQKRYDEAIVQYKKYMQYGNDNATACQYISTCYQYLNKPDSANLWLEKAQNRE